MSKGLKYFNNHFIIKSIYIFASNIYHIKDYEWMK